MNLYLAEYDHQVQEFLDQPEAQEGVWVALGPSAMHYLSSRGIPYAIPEDFITREEIEAVCVSQFELLTQVCRKLDNILLEDDPFLKQWGIRPFYFHLWQLGQMFDLLLSRTLTLKRMVEHFPEARVNAHLGTRETWSLSDLCFPLEGNLWGQLLNLSGWSFPVRLWPEKKIGRDQAKGAARAKSGGESFNFKVFLSSLSQTNPGRHSWVFSIRRRWWRNLWNIWQHGRSGKKCGVVICNGLYEWSSILPDLITKGHAVYCFYGENLLNMDHPTGYTGSTRVLQVNPLWDKFREGLPPLPVDFISLIQDRLDFIIEKGAIVAQHVVKNLEEFFSGKKIAALLISVGTDFGSYVAKQYCRVKNIRVLAWQHGAEWYNQRISQRIDLLDLVSCDLMLVYGDAVKNGYTSSPIAREEKSEIISVGMPSLKALREISPISCDREIRILWVCGGYYKDWWYCGFSPPQSDRFYYQEQIVFLNNILELVNNYPKLSVTVKLYHSAKFNPPWVTEISNMDKVKIVLTTPNFTELLPEHDLVIIDSPTTTLLQAVATKLPVFVSMSVIRWPDEAIKLLRKRACCAEGATDLMKSLNQFIENGACSFNVADEKFLTQYGTHNGNGDQVALSIMEKLLNDNSSTPDQS